MCLTEAPFNPRDTLGAARRNHNRTARSVWSAWSLLPLSNHLRVTTAPASWTHSMRFAWQFIRKNPRGLWTAVRFINTERFSFPPVKGTAISEHDVSMGGHSQARRTCAAVVRSLLLGAGLAGAEPPDGQGLFPPQSTVVLLAGVPGDVESEESYRDQLQSWLELAKGSGQAARIFVLCDEPQAVVLSGSTVTSNQLSVISNQSSVVVLRGDRASFLGLGKPLAGGTNALIVIAWGHGGRQGNKPVLHVRGPRITAADFKAVAGQATAGE